MEPQYVDDISYSVSNVMKKYPLMVQTLTSIRKESEEDLRQEIVSYLIETSIPRWESDRKVNFKTFLYTCSKNHLINLTTKYSSRARREKGVWEYFKTAHDWNSFKEVANVYYRTLNYVDREMVSLALSSLVFSDYDIEILKMTAQKKTLRDVGEKFNCSPCKVRRDRISLMRRIKVNCY